MEIDKEKINHLLNKGNYSKIESLLLEYLSSTPSLDTYSFCSEKYKQIAKKLKYPSFKTAILRTITIEPMIPLFEANCFENKINPEIYIGNYNTIDQEILSEDSALYSFNPELLIIFARLEETCPEFLNGFLDLSKEEIDFKIKDICERYRNLFSSFRKYSPANILMHNFELPEFPILGIADNATLNGQKHTITKLNEELSKISKEFNQVHICDYDHLISIHGRKHWFDEKMWFHAKAPLSLIGIKALSSYYLNFIKVFLGLTKKCLVLDLDNTLWGGSFR